MCFKSAGIVNMTLSWAQWLMLEVRKEVQKEHTTTTDIIRTMNQTANNAKATTRNVTDVREGLIAKAQELSSRFNATSNTQAITHALGYIIGKAQTRDADILHRTCVLMFRIRPTMGPLLGVILQQLLMIVALANGDQSVFRVQKIVNMQHRTGGSVIRNAGYLREKAIRG